MLRACSCMGAPADNFDEAGMLTADRMTLRVSCSMHTCCRVFKPVTLAKP